MVEPVGVKNFEEVESFLSSHEETVFTPKEYRQKGYAKAVMFHMLKDCRDLHGHLKNILFTGETDIPAQKLYESMGYKRIGYFALVLGK